MQFTMEDIMLIIRFYDIFLKSVEDLREYKWLRQENCFYKETLSYCDEFSLYPNILLFEGDFHWND